MGVGWGDITGRFGGLYIVGENPPPILDRGGETEPTSPPLPVIRRWFLNFSSLRHLARRLLNQTYK